MSKGVQIDGTFDIECAAWDRMVTGALYSRIHGARIVKTPDELVDSLLRRGGTWWAWNGGRFDTLLVADVLLRRGLTVTCSMSGSSINRLVSGSLTILDACALVPMPLEQAAALGGHAAPRGFPWGCRCGEDCGGYCAIRTGMPAKYRKIVDDYCAHDAKVAYDVIANVLTVGVEAGLSMRATLGGTSWATAMAWGKLAPANWRSEVWRLVRGAYFGGRTWVAKPLAAVGTHWDLASAYPAALASTPVPVGEWVEGAGRRARLAYRRGLHGVYRARVVVPDRYLPPLPVRERDRSILYPIGPIRGTWTLPELQAAEGRGCKIVSVDECVAWPDGAELLYAPIVDRWFRERMKAGKRTVWGEWWRLLANALTGKLAEQPERMSVVINPPQIRYCSPEVPSSRLAGCTKEWCTKRCAAYRMLDADGRVWGVPFFRLGECAHIHHAAYLTGATRMRVQDAAERIPAEDLVYSDTDSLWTTGGTPEPAGEEAGHWTFKHAWGDFVARAPKVYRYVSPDGEVVCRVAGMPHLTDDEWRRAAADRKLISSRHGVLTLKEAAPSGRLFRRRVREGRLPEPDGWYGDRRLRLADGRTYPVTYAEAKERRRTRSAPPSEKP